MVQPFVALLLMDFNVVLRIASAAENHIQAPAVTPQQQHSLDTMSENYLVLAL